MIVHFEDNNNSYSLFKMMYAFKKKRKKSEKIPKF
jgi:hypothetical protein